MFDDSSSRGKNPPIFLSSNEIQKKMQAGEFTSTMSGGRSAFLQKSVLQNQTEDLSGHSTCYRVVNFRGDTKLLGSVVDVTIYRSKIELTLRQGGNGGVIDGESDLVEVKIGALIMDPNTNTPIVVLKGIESETVLPIWVGAFEANAIALEIEKIVPQRPMTHDLLRNVIIECGLRASRVILPICWTILSMRRLNLPTTTKILSRWTRGLRMRSHWHLDWTARFMSVRRCSIFLHAHSRKTTGNPATLGQMSTIGPS